MVLLSDLVTWLDTWYDPAWAEDWDAVGLVCGDPGQPVTRVLLAVDPSPEVVAEAVDWGADLLVCHHPLLLRPVHSVAATSPKGHAVHRLVREGVALFTAHTNADVPPDGVNDALARAVGVVDPQVVLRTDDGTEASPHPGAGPGAGSGAEPGADPGADPVPRGHGRIGRLAEPTTLGGFAVTVAAVLPATAHGVRVSGDPERLVRTVVVGSGAGDFLLDAVRSTDADAYLTSDLRHHRAAEFLEHGGPDLVDVAHWAAEWTWLPVVERKLVEAARRQGATVETRVSRRVTDPWSFRVDPPTAAPLGSPR